MGAGVEGGGCVCVGGGGGGGRDGEKTMGESSRLRERSWRVGVGG